MIPVSTGDEKRVVVEIFSHPEAERLRAEMKSLDELHRAEINRLERRLEGLHKTLYEVIEAISKNSRK